MLEFFVFLQTFMWKIAGSLAGSLLALAVSKPKSRGEATIRAVVGTSCGFMGGPLLRDYFVFRIGDGEIQFALWGASAFLGWMIVGALFRIGEELTMQNIVELVKAIRGSK